MSSLPDWEQVLTSASHLQRIIPNTVLVGGTAAAIDARHRRSGDADHRLTGQLASPRPYDRDETDLPTDKGLFERYDDWSKLERVGLRVANALFDSLLGIADHRGGGTRFEQP